ncbi:hypothetical protein ScPMuIL_012023 [Solemya velum]
MSFGFHRVVAKSILCSKCQHCKYLGPKKLFAYSNPQVCVPVRTVTGESPTTVTHPLYSRNVIQMEGPDVQPLLQGLVTNDVTLLDSCSAMYTMMLNAQGRVLYDLILYNVSRESDDTHLLIECDAGVTQELLTVLKRYKIRRKVDIADVSDKYRVSSALVSDGHTTHSLPRESQVIFRGEDPRVPGFGWRIITKSAASDEYQESRVSGEYAYHESRYRWGIAEGMLDLPPGNCFPLESNLEYMNGVCFKKGCYIGQELTARTYHTGVTRKHLVPIVFDRVPESLTPGQNITSDAGKNIGKFRHSVGIHGLGMIRIAEMQRGMKICSPSGMTYNLTAHIPDWWPKSS